MRLASMRGMVRGMNLPAPLHLTLAMLAVEMVGLAGPWWVISGAAAALHGIRDTRVGDVDVLTTRADAEILLRRFGLPVVAGATHDVFRSSVFGCWQQPPLTVEIMAGFEVKDAAGWSSVWFQTREEVKVDGLTLFIPARHELAAVLDQFGRPKDRVRAAALRCIVG